MSPDRQQNKTFFIPAALADPKFYSHGVSINDRCRLIYTSGQIGQHQDGSFPGDYKEQVQLAFQNLATVLQSTGAKIRDVIKLTFYCVDWNYEEAPDFVEPLFDFLSDHHGIRHRPLTTLVPVPQLADPRAKFEVEAVAAVGGNAQPWIEEASYGAFVVPPMETDVVVVGGGFSGLQAAYDLQSAGIDCILLEAKSRIGGRSHTKQLASGRGLVELGATWINRTTQPKVYGLAQQFGLDCVEQYQTGDQVWQDSNGSVWRVKQGELPYPPTENRTSDLYDLLEKMEQEQSKVEITRPGQFPTSSDISVEDWLEQSAFSQFTKDFMRFFVSALVGREAREVGLHYIMDYIKSGGGYNSLASEGEHGAQSLKIKQGTSAIATSLARGLKAGSVMLNSPVNKIQQYGRTCMVETANGLKINCKKVIMAIPTNVYGNIHFSPPLPMSKRAIVSRTKPGVYAKVVLTYAKPWWRDIGLVGTFNSVKGPVCFSWEISDFQTNNYSLAIFIAGDAAHNWHQLSSLRREEAVLSHLAELVGHEHGHLALDVLEINEKEWTKEEFIGGAPTSAMGVGELSKYGQALRDPFINIHFGGGETAFEWKGYLEGALRAGSRVAEEIIRSLQPGLKI